ncbi:MAG: hypothetical protein V1866_01580 [archaeon]
MNTSLGLTNNGLFRIYERLQFFYNRRDEPGFVQKKQTIEAKLGRSLEPKMKELTSDLMLLLKGDEAQPGYRRALARYIKNCDGMADEQLRQYYDFLCSTFKIQVPEQEKTMPEPPVLIPSRKLEELINYRNQLKTYDDEDPF